nr:helix-turn-helix domain-containing protein [Planosporangium thailandense]
MVLQRDRLLDDLRASRERELVRDLLSADPEVRVAAADALAALEEPQAGPARVVVVNVPAAVDMLADELIAKVDRALDRVARQLVPRRCLRLVRVDHGLLIVPLGPGGRDIAPDVARAARAALQRVLHGTEVRSGVGDRVNELADAVNSYRQARTAVRVSEVIPGFGPDVAWSELGVYRILVHLPLDELPEDAIPPELLALLDSPSGREIVRSVEVYLDRAGDARAAVDALKIHRTTLYYRLGRFAELTGLNLSDGGDRLAVHVGLKLARLRGSYTP